MCIVLSVRSKTRLQKEIEEREALQHEKDLVNRLFDGMTAIVDRFASVNLETDTYEYHERASKKPLYPRTGSFSKMVREASDVYAILSDTENIKFTHVLSPEHIRAVLATPSDVFRIEYADRTGSRYKVINVVPVAWDSDGKLVEILLIAQDIGQRVELEKMANTDGLTGLFNERYLSKILHSKEDKKIPFAIYYLDLNLFKPVNDTYGHDVGDELLKLVAQRIQASIRDKDFAFRIGGDEFCLVITAVFTEEQCDALVVRLKEALSKPFDIDGIKISIGTSCAYARYPEDGTTASEVRKLADMRMYSDKKKSGASR